MTKGIRILLLISFFILPFQVFAQNKNPEGQFPGGGGQFNLDEFLKRQQESAANVPVKLRSKQSIQEVKVDKETGTISLDIKGMDILDILKMLAKRANLNVVVGKNVKGKISMFLKDVSPLEALEMILASNDLAYVKTGEIINVITAREYEARFGVPYSEERQLQVIKLKYVKAANLTQPLNQIKTKIGKVVIDDATNTVILFDAPDSIWKMQDLIKTVDTPLETKIFELNYADAKTIESAIQEVLTKNVGMLKYDERTNKIVVTDYPENMKKIERIIEAFDEKNLQVLIDAQIVEVKPSDEFKAGIDWDYWLKKNLRITGNLSTTAGDILTIGTTNVVEVGEYKGILDMLRTIGETKVLSSPSIMAINNQEAKILVGTKDAYVTSSTTQQDGTAITSETVNYVDTGVKLFVTPTISRDGFVTMKIKPEVSSAERVTLTSGDKNFQIPIVSTSEAETSVVVKDGVTVIIAGLKKDTKSKTVQKIPFLADIPFLGALFRNKDVDSNKTELVIFLTPHIVSGDRPFPYASLTKDSDITNKAVNSSLTLYKKQIKQQSFEDYKNTILEKVRDQARKFRTKEGSSGKVEVGFALSKDGKLQTEPIILFSTNNIFNSIAIKSIKQACPFPNFPSNFGKELEYFKAVLFWE